MSRSGKLGWVLTSRPVGAAALAGLVVIFLGCMSLSIGERKVVEKIVPAECTEEGVLCQEGKVTFQRGSSQVVYYPIPYASPPNLEINQDGPFCFSDDVILVEQKDDHFIVRTNSSGSPVTVRWRARGLRRPAAPVPTPAGPALPPRPVPVEQPAP
jgi:hypothetical protein